MQKQNDSYENNSDISFDIFKELLGLLFFVQFILPNVTDCLHYYLLHRFYSSIFFKNMVCWFESSLAKTRVFFH